MVRSLAGVRDYSLLVFDKMGSGFRPASYLMGNNETCVRGKVDGEWS